MPFITYQQANGQVAVIIPADNSLSIEEIAKKDVPTGSPYKIVESLEIKDEFFNSYVFDQTKGAILDFSKAKLQKTKEFNLLVYNEYAHRAVKGLAGIENVLSDSDWKTLLNISQAAIDNSTTIDELLAAIVPVQEAIAANSAI
jgi:uncharacterized membrane protein